MTTRKRLEGTLADWHPHPKDNKSLAPVVRDAVASDAPVVQDAVAPVVPDAVASDTPVVPDAVASDAPVVQDAVAPAVEDADAPVPDAVASDAPVVRDAVASDEIADRFFDSAPQLTTPEPPVVVAEAAPRLVAIDSAAVRARRRYLMRYVAGAVTVAGIIGLAAIVRVTMASAADTPRMTSAIAASLSPAVAPEPPADPVVLQPAADPVAPQPGPALAADPPSPAAAVAAPPGAALAAAAVAAPPAAADIPPPAEAPAPPTVAADLPAAANPAPPADATEIPAQSTQAAGNAKKDALRALERGRVAESIEAGEQSVALDPGDADAWLILGAAYQQQGRSVEARRCFTTCAAHAQRGPRGECRALLR
jgi:nicotinate-nucleotide--dimethylbenzimidazole phosphoribosyltransferase